MTAEVPLQIDMFTGELKDTRTRRQKRAGGYRQLELFHPREVTQRVNTRPEMPAIARNGQKLHMALEIQDPRTDEEKEMDRQREVEELTEPLPQVEAPIEEGRVIDPTPSEVVLPERW